jgi:hypothetical protein
MEGRGSYVMIFLIEIRINFSYDDQSWLRRLEVWKRKESGVVLF